MTGERTRRSGRDVGLELWRVAGRWRRQVNAELTPLGLTLVQWSILEETHRLIVDTGDAVSQMAVASGLEMDKMTLSHAMRALQRRGLVDRGPDLTGPAYRIWLTSEGERMRQQGCERVEVASLATLGSHGATLDRALRPLARGSRSSTPSVNLHA